MALLDKVSGPGLVRRILSSLVLAPPVLAAVHFGSPWVELLLVLAAAEMAREWAKLCDGGRVIPGGVVIAAGAIVAILLVSRSRIDLALIVVVATVAAAFVAGLSRGRETAVWLALGVPVVALPAFASSGSGSRPSRGGRSASGSWRRSGRPTSAPMRSAVPSAVRASGPA